mgnify:CR=1 FL=1
MGLREAVKGADLVVLAVPVGVMGEIAAEIGPHLKPGATVTDVGSVKQAVIRDVAPHLPEGVHLVPGHPVAGTEHSGPDSGFAELFIGRWCILTPPDGTDPMAIEALRTGKVTVTGDLYPTVEVNFGRDASLTKALAGAVRWGEAGVEPLDDVQAWSLLVTEKSGATANTLVMDVEAWKLFSASPKPPD